MNTKQLDAKLKAECIEKFYKPLHVDEFTERISSMVASAIRSSMTLLHAIPQAQRPAAVKAFVGALQHYLDAGVQIAEETPASKTIEHPNSSQVKSSHHDPLTKVLTVEFRNGGKYTYAGVPQEVYTGLCEAESTGKYLNASIKGKYPYKRLEEGKPE